jgi:hypothetical protein
VEGIRFTFNDVDLVVTTFDFSSMDRIIVVINYTTAMTLKLFLQNHLATAV